MSIPAEARKRSRDSKRLKKEVYNTTRTNALDKPQNLSLKTYFNPALPTNPLMDIFFLAIRTSH